jgi:antitoxin component YwqK of YwqJK toxin-antitoxin module
LMLFALVVPMFGQQESEREEYGYLDAVKSVRTETVSYTFESGKAKAGKSRLESLETFDGPGNLLECIEYNDDGVLNWHQKNIFEGGRAIGWEVITSPNDEWSKFLYEFDDPGNIIEQAIYDDDGELSIQWKYLYDQQNRKVQETSQTFYSDRPSDLRVTTYSYDEKGRLLEEKTFVNGENGLAPGELSGVHQRMLIYEGGKWWTSARSYSKDGQLVRFNQITRDDRGNEIEDIDYDGAGNIKHKIRYEYKFDRRGNWIVQKTSRWNTESGQGLYQLDEIEYRKIEYFKK